VIRERTGHCFIQILSSVGSYVSAVEGEGRFVSVYVMGQMERGGRRTTTPLILTLGTSWRSVINFTTRPLYLSGNKPLVLTEQETGWAPGLIWTFLRDKKFLAYVGNRKRFSRSFGLVSISTEVPRLLRGSSRH
jgi:hypothetical protein